MNNINEKMAKVMGWHSGKDPMHGLDCWDNKSNKCAKLKKDWHPTDKGSLNQAMMCADKLHEYYQSKSDDGTHWFLCRKDKLSVWYSRAVDTIEELPLAICETILKTT